MPWTKKSSALSDGRNSGGHLAAGVACGYSAWKPSPNLLFWLLPDILQRLLTFSCRVLSGAAPRSSGEPCRRRPIPAAMLWCGSISTNLWDTCPCDRATGRPPTVGTACRLFLTCMRQTASSNMSSYPRGIVARLMYSDREKPADIWLLAVTGRADRREHLPVAWA